MSSTVGKVATDTLKLAVATAASPGGLQLLIGLLGIANPAVSMVVQFGVRLLAGVLPTITAAEVSDDDVMVALQKTGARVEPYNPMEAFAA